MFEVVLGLYVTAEFHTRYATLLLTPLCALTGIYVHFVPDDPMQMTNFIKNAALTGGFLLLDAHGAGALGIGARGRNGRA